MEVLDVLVLESKVQTDHVIIVGHTVSHPTVAKKLISVPICLENFTTLIHTTSCCVNGRGRREKRREREEEEGEGEGEEGEERNK